MRRYLIFFLFLAYLTGESQTIVNGYYITLNNDTIQTKIIYSDIIELQKVLKIEELNGEKKVFIPNEIKGFCLKKDSTLKLINFSNYSIFPNQEYNNILEGSILNDEISSLSKPNKLKLFDSLSSQKEYLFFRSFKNTFIKSISAKGALQTYKYYYYLIPNASYQGLKVPIPIKFLECNLFTFKDDKYIPYPTGCTVGKCRKWLSKLVSDYSLLSKLIMEKNFPMDFLLIYNTYNEWYIQKSLKNDSLINDTLVVMRGIFDAKKYYRPTKIFWTTFTGSIFIVFPGMIAGLIMKDNAIKHNKVKIPNVNIQFMKDEKYILGYRSMAYLKNQRAVDRGVLFGTIVCIPLLIILAGK